MTNIQESWALLEGGVVYRGSTAWLRAVRYCYQPWRFLGNAFLFVPECVREPVYNLIARNRYRLFGKSDACQRPGKELKARLAHPA